MAKMTSAKGIDAQYDLTRRCDRKAADLPVCRVAIRQFGVL